jgi:hypothetical protein
MKIRRLDLDDKSINQEHEALSIPPVEYQVTHTSDHPLLRIASDGEWRNTFGGSIHLWSVWCIASKNGNVNKKLFFSLLIPGIIGGLIGTYVLSSIDGNVLKPYISFYLLVMGLYV